jgi:hypothetical protein
MFWFKPKYDPWPSLVQNQTEILKQIHEDKTQLVELKSQLALTQNQLHQSQEMYTQVAELNVELQAEQGRKKPVHLLKDTAANALVTEIFELAEQIYPLYDAADTGKMLAQILSNLSPGHLEALNHDRLKETVMQCLYAYRSLMAVYKR